MTVASETSRVTYAGNSSTTAFAVNFPFLENEDLVVLDVTDSDGSSDTLVLDTDYTVTGAGGASGTVTCTVAPATGHTLVIYRDPAMTQETDYEENDAFPAATHERALDKLTMISQRTRQLVDRALVLPDSVTATVDTTLPSPSAGAVLVWNDDEDGLENGPTVATIEGAAASAAAAAASAAAAATAQANAETAETNAETAEANAEAAALAAQAAADSIGFRDVVFLTSADSPYTVTSATSGKLLSCATSGGAISITLPTIATLTLPFTVGVKKATGDANAVTINRGGTDTFDDGTTSKSITGIAGTTLIPDADPAPDKWTAADWGAAAGQQKKQRFVAGVGYTAGISTTITLSETPLPATADTLEIFFDASYQHETEWTLNTTTGVVTFGSAIPGGVAAIECVWTTPLAIGAPADGTVTTAKLSDQVFNGLTTVTITSSDSVAIADASDSGNKKKALVSDIVGLGPRMPRRASGGTETLVAADMSKVVVTSTASTLTLPLLSAVEDGQLIGFELNAAVDVTIQRQGSDELSWAQTAALNSVKLTQYGDYLVLWADKTSSRWRVLSDGIQGPAFSATYSGAGQTLGGAGVATKLQFNSESTDSHGYYDPTTNYRFTPLIPGWYHITAQIYMSHGGGAENRHQVAIYKNGSLSVTATNQTTNDANTTVSSLVYFNGTTDYVEVYGVGIDTNTTFNSTRSARFLGVRIR